MKTLTSIILMAVAAVVLIGMQSMVNTIFKADLCLIIILTIMGANIIKFKNWLFK